MKYGSAYEKFPIHPGDIINAGEHRLYCGDLLDLKDDLAKEKVDMIYCDPPWDLRILKRFYKGAGAEIPEGGLSKIIEGIAYICYHANPDGITFLDMGKSFTPHMIEILEHRGLYTYAIAECYYDSDHKPCTLWAGGRIPGAVDLGIPEWMHGKEVIEWVVDNLPQGGRFMDMCAGVGTYPLTAMKRRNARIVGAEIQPRKLANFVLSLEKKGYEIKVNGGRK